MAVSAQLKGLAIAPRKVGVVAALVRGHTVTDAITILEHTPRRAALPVKKLVASARANAENNHNFKPDTLKIVEISVTHGPRMKRYRPVAQGRALPYMKRTSHIFVTVDGEQRVIKKTSEKKTEKKPEGKE